MDLLRRIAILALLCSVSLEPLQAQRPPLGPRTRPPVGGYRLPRIPPRERQNLLSAQMEPPLAMSGFCPVTLRDQRRWVEGDRQLKAAFDGQLYHLAGERERARFAAAPLRYAPVLGGDCPVTFLLKGQRVAGQIQFGLIHNGRTYFFASAENRERFRADPERFADADLAFGGLCPVYLKDSNRQQPGRRDTTLTVAGLRYCFAGVYQRERFMQNPADYISHDLPLPSWAARDPHGLDAFVSRQTRTPAAAADAAETETAEEPRSAQPIGKLMLRGFCPVTLIEKHTWELGSSDLALDYDGRQYLFAGEAERARFLEDPYRYVPAFGGNCVVSLVDEGRIVSGSLRQAKFHVFEDRWRLYMFASAEKAEAYHRHAGPLRRRRPVRTPATASSASSTRETAWPATRRSARSTRTGVTSSRPRRSVTGSWPTPINTSTPVGPDE